MIAWVYLTLLVAMTIWAYCQKSAPALAPGTLLDTGSTASDHLVWGFLCFLLSYVGAQVGSHLDSSLPEPIRMALGLHLPLCIVFLVCQKGPLWLTPALQLKKHPNPIRIVGLSFLRWWAPLKLLHQASISLLEWGAQRHAWPPLTNSSTLEAFLSTDTPTGTLIAVGLIVVLLAPMGEEYLFRGLLFPVLRSRLGPHSSAVLCGLLFASVHSKPSGFLAITLLGYLLCRLYEQYRNIWIPIGLHSLFNANAFIFAVSSNFTH